MIKFLLKWETAMGLLIFMQIGLAIHFAYQNRGLESWFCIGLAVLSLIIVLVIYIKGSKKT